MYGALQAIGLALEACDCVAAGYTDRVAAKARELVQEPGMSQTELRDLRCRAYLHGERKLTIPATILLKSGKLTTGELSTMRARAPLGDNLVRIQPFLPSTTWPVVWLHQLRDGRGYPEGRVGFSGHGPMGWVAQGEHQRTLHYAPHSFLRYDEVQWSNFHGIC